MKIHSIALVLCLVPCVAGAATRDENARIGVNRVSMAGMRSMPNLSVDLQNGATGGGNHVAVNTDTGSKTESGNGGNNGGTGNNDNNGNNGGGNNSGGNDTAPSGDSSCRDAYRACMDEFCLLDESEGYRCACSDNINKSKDLIQEIQKIQADADNLYTEGVEREQLGAKASLVFGQSDAAKKSSRVSGLSFSEWLNSGVTTDDETLGGDTDIGSGLYSMAANYCADTLKSCGTRSEMETVLYSRQIVADCKSFESYLADQKLNAQANKRTAEAAVRKARLEMLDTTNKYNRGECLLAYRSCVADKGGCGVNFENCLDADLLGRRANACENVLDQCMASRSYVLADWESESQSILVDAAKYADKYARQTCLARIQACLEDNCSTATNSACLTNVDVAAGICTVITECEELVPGIRSAVNDKLGYLRTQFCQNDVDKCLQDKCGQNFTGPECLGKKATDIAALCPQSMFPSCKNETQFNIILQATLMQMDYSLMQGCLNYFGDQLGRACGTDMSCLPGDDTVASLVSVPEKDSELAELRSRVRANAAAAVDDFFAQFENDVTVAACRDSQKPAGRANLGTSVFNTAKLIANISAENRALRALESRIAELSRQQDTERARQNCYNTYAVEKPNKDDKNYSYIRSVSFEPDLRNCHVCRMQQVCETGGESKWTSALKSGAGLSAAGASAGTMVTPGWGTAIGGVVGLVGGGLMGLASGGKEEFCQEIESCEDVNM